MRSTRNKILFKIVRLPIPWRLRRLISATLSFFTLKFRVVESCQILETLKKEGQVIRPIGSEPLISNDVVDDFFSRAKGSLLKDAWLLDKSQYYLTDVPENINVSTVVFKEDFESEIVKLGEEIAQLPLIKGYFNAVPKLDNYQIWFSHRNRVSNGPQLWHRDIDNILFLKVFIYLDDVDESDGPHYYIKGSHRWNRFLSFRRFTDSELSNHFPELLSSYSTGSKGTLIVEDTFGLHKGAVPLGSRDRCLLQYQFALFKNP